MVARMPAAAVKDMMEWGPAATPEEQFQRVLSTELPIDSLINAAPDTPMLSDDRPINEYFLLRAMAAARRNEALNSTTGQIRRP